MNFLNVLLMFLMNDRLMMLMDVFLSNNRLVHLGDHILMMFM